VEYKTDSNDYLDDLSEVFMSRFLPEHEWLIKLSRKHSLKIMLLQDIIDALEKMRNLEKEGEPLNVGLILKKEHVKLLDPLIKRREFHVSSYSNFFHLKNIVSGSTLSYVVDEKGMVTIGQIPASMLKENSRLTLKGISHSFQTLTFYVGNSAVEICDGGELVRTNRRGLWLKPCIIPLEELNKRGFPLALLNLVFNICLEMSEENQGGIFAIVKDERPKYCSSMTKGYHFKKCKIDQIPKSQIMSFAGLDGAVILNTKSELMNIGQKLEPPITVKVIKEAGRGTRHDSAKAYSKAVDSVIFVVSKDGPISIYYNGNLFGRCFEELFGTK
jgi:hypothetical protein